MTQPTFLEFPIRSERTSKRFHFLTSRENETEGNATKQNHLV